MDINLSKYIIKTINTKQFKNIFYNKTANRKYNVELPKVNSIIFILRACFFAKKQEKWIILQRTCSVNLRYAKILRACTLARYSFFLLSCKIASM